MPLIVVNTNLSLEKKQKDDITSKLGEVITILPNKTEKVLMVDISDGHTIYFRGKEPERAAHVDVRLYGTCPFALKAEFTRAVYKLLNETTGLQDDEVYVEIAEYGTWGTQGDLK